MQSLGFHDKNPMMFEMVQRIRADRNGGNVTFAQFAEDLANLLVSGHNSGHGEQNGVWTCSPNETRILKDLQYCGTVGNFVLG